MSTAVPTATISTRPLWGFYLFNIVVLPLLAWNAPFGLTTLERQAIIAVLEFVMLFAAVGTAISLHDRARGTVQPQGTFLVKGLLTMLLPAALLGLVGALVGRWVGYLGDVEAPMLPWSVIGANVAAILFLALFWFVPVAIYRPDLIRQTPAVMGGLVMVALAGCGFARADWVLLLILTAGGLWYQEERPGLPHSLTLAAFYGVLVVGTVRVLLATAFAALAGALLFADASALFEAVRRSAPEQPGFLLIVFIAVLLAALTAWRSGREDISGLFRLTDALLQTAAFAVLLLLFHAVTDADARRALEDTVRAAAGSGGFTYRCIVMAGAYFALADTIRAMRRWASEPPETTTAASTVPAPPG